jgi:DNA-binding HxlR family transcriptional regulator
MEFQISDKCYTCPVELTLGAIGGKWKVLLLWKLKDGVIRYGELKRLMPGITHKMLSQSLKELEQDGIVNRKVYQVIPPMVEYSMTSSGEKLLPVLSGMQQWGLTFKVKEPGKKPRAVKSRRVVA